MQTRTLGSSSTATFTVRFAPTSCCWVDWWDFRVYMPAHADHKLSVSESDTVKVYA